LPSALPRGDFLDPALEADDHVFGVEFAAVECSFTPLRSVMVYDLAVGEKPCGMLSASMGTIFQLASKV
jgi:hypothetical protein